MAKMLLADSLKELRMLIDQQHLLYLEFDENPQKIDQRNKLESYIKEYLCLAPHNTKFTFQETANVLHQSASTKINFSAYKAALAWKAIGKYADNLISHPWRKEYRNIKLYCGFYKHEIEESLVGAEQMFEAMGYRHNRQSSLALYGILDPDRITSVSKDAILAYVECQIMKQIWETLSPQYQITWLEILEFRENHISTPDQVISSLTHKYCQNQYQEKAFHRQTQTMNNHYSIQPDSIYKHNSMGYFNHPQYSGHSYSAALQNRYCPMGIPQHAVSSSALYTPQAHSHDSSHHMLKPHNTYSINGHHRHSNYPSQLNLMNFMHNGYPLESMAYPIPSVVPTGQLIEFDSSPNFNGCETYFQRTNPSKHKCPQDEFSHLQSALKNEEPSLSGKAKDDGAGSWENWDYVYRNLESHGYKKNLDSGEFSLKGNQHARFQNNECEADIDGIIQTDVSDKIRKINLNKPVQVESNSSTDGSNELKSKCSKEKTKVDIDIPRQPKKVKNEVKSRKSSPERIKKESVGAENNPVNNIVYAKVNLNQKKENDRQTTMKESIKSRKSRENVKPLIVNLKDAEEKWQCVTCTYLNSAANNICEMCCKSKERGNEINPQPTGGPECPKCTLVNKPGVNYCSACNAFLKDSPTYI